MVFLVLNNIKYPIPTKISEGSPVIKNLIKEYGTDEINYDLSLSDPVFSLKILENPNYRISGPLFLETINLVSFLDFGVKDFFYKILNRRSQLVGIPGLSSEVLGLCIKHLMPFGSDQIDRFLTEAFPEIKLEEIYIFLAKQVNGENKEDLFSSLMPCFISKKNGTKKWLPVLASEYLGQTKYWITKNYFLDLEGNVRKINGEYLFIDRYIKLFEVGKELIFQEEENGKWSFGGKLYASDPISFKMDNNKLKAIVLDNQIKVINISDPLKPVSHHENLRDYIVKNIRITNKGCNILLSNQYITICKHIDYNHSFTHENYPARHPNVIAYNIASWKMIFPEIKDKVLIKIIKNGQEPRQICTTLGLILTQTGETLLLKNGNPIDQKYLEINNPDWLVC